MLDRVLDLPAPVRYVLFGLITVAVMALCYISLSGPSEDDHKKDTPSSSTSVRGNDTPSTGVTNETEEDVIAPIEGVNANLGMPVDEGAIKVAAGDAVRFVEVYNSYRYDQSDARKRTELNNLLSNETSVFIDDIFPTGDIQSQMKAEHVVIDAKAESVTVTMVSAQVLTFLVETVETTSNNDGVVATENNSYAVTLANETGRKGFHVTNISTASGSENAAVD